MILDKTAARKLTDRVCKLATAKDVVVGLAGGRTANTRFANNEITSCGDVSNVRVSVAVAFGQKRGSTATNQLDDASLRAAVAEAEEMARLSPDDPEHMPPLPPQKIAEVKARDPKMAAGAAFDAAANQKGVEACLGPSLEKKLVAAGFFESADRFQAVANSAGAFAYHAATAASFSTTVRTADGTGSGWAEATSWKLGDVDAPAVARRAVEKSERSVQPRRLDPGRYTVVLEPEAVAGLVGMVRFGLRAREADEGRSYLSKPGGGNRVGEKLFSDKVTILSDPGDARIPGQPFDGEGLALKPTTWIEKGVVKELIYGRYWAQKQGREPTGAPANIIMLGGSATLQDMIKSTDKGILVTRFWYIRSVDPRTLLVTGITRDGTFWIEKGEVTHPVNNFRFNDSPASLFANAEALSAPVRTSSGLAVPAVKAHSFNMASISVAV